MKKFLKGLLQWFKKHKVVTALLVLIIAAAIILPNTLLKKKQFEMPTQQIGQNTVELEKTDLTKSVSATGTIESAKS